MGRLGSTGWSCVESVVCPIGPVKPPPPAQGGLGAASGNGGGAIGGAGAAGGLGATAGAGLALGPALGLELALELAAGACSAGPLPRLEGWLAGLGAAAGSGLDSGEGWGHQRDPASVVPRPPVGLASRWKLPVSSGLGGNCRTGMPFTIGAMNARQA
jgi:hypothetical protein